ncbi:hypothetical protein GQ457_02G017150 [Hibiscus cannabinus]
MLLLPPMNVEFTAGTDEPHNHNKKRRQDEDPPDKGVRPSSDVMSKPTQSSSYKDMLLGDQNHVNPDDEDFLDEEDIDLNEGDVHGTHTLAGREENWSKAERVFFPEIILEKSTKKRYGSLKQIQDKSISEKERKRRDRAIRREKQFGKGEEEPEVSGRSLSESDPINHKKTLLKRAKRTLALGKRLGVDIEGNEEGCPSNYSIEKMRLLTWNIRGLGTVTKVNAVKNIVRNQRIDLILLQETKKETFSEVDIGKIWVDDQFDFQFSGATGKSGGLLVLWDISKFDLVLVQAEPNFILLKGKWLPGSLEVLLGNVYGPSQVKDQVKV